jgi:transcriptional regulator with XRE-family HTH domain
MATPKANPDSVASVREKMRRAAEQSGMTQEEIGIRMGYAKDSARKAVSRLLNADVDYDPRLSTLLSFAQALGISLKDILG